MEAYMNVAFLKHVEHIPRSSSVW